LTCSCSTHCFQQPMLNSVLPLLLVPYCAI
jgi:hypothetical protein